MIKGIYKITNPENKIYIGYSTNLIRRIENYNTLKCIGQVKLYRSLKKYGRHKHIFEVLEYLPDDSNSRLLSCKERFHYDMYINKGYEMLNIRIPGENGIIAHSEETKLQICIKKSIYKQVTQFDKTGKFIKFWDEPSSVVGKKLGIASNHMLSNIRGNIPFVKGFIFKEGKILEDILPPVKKRSSRTNYFKKSILVHQYDKNFKLIKSWNSALEANSIMQEIPLYLIQKASKILGKAGEFIWSRKIL